MVRLRNAPSHLHDRACLGPEDILAVFDLIEIDPDAGFSPSALRTLTGIVIWPLEVIFAVGMGFLSKSIIPYFIRYFLTY